MLNAYKHRETLGHDLDYSMHRKFPPLILRTSVENRSKKFEFEGGHV